jgi:hypothetical protein
MIVRTIATRLRHFIRRQKWRLRPLKELILPIRNSKRRIVTLFGRIQGKTPLRIERATADYLGPDKAIEVYPAESVKSLPGPFRQGTEVPHADLSEPAYIFELPHIDFWARYGGSIVTADNVLLGDLSPDVWGTENHPIFSSFRLPKARTLPGQTAILVTPEARGNYYHWLVDLLPRALLLRTVAGDFKKFDQILINASGAPYEEASLRAVDVPLEKLIPVGENDRFQMERATIPSMDHHSKIVAPWKIRELRRMRDRMLDIDPVVRSAAATTRIYISRKRSPVRRLLNEADLVPLLQKAGFAIIEMELLEWPEQVRLFSNAEIVIGPHGAAFANVVFCKPNTVIAEIVARAGYLDFYLHLAVSGQLHYRCIEARARTQRSSSFRAFENEDLVLDECELENFLREL